MPELYTVFGYWEDNGQRYGRFDEADSAVHAELLMQRRAAKENAVFWAAATLRGEFHPVDAAYTRYLDPQDPRNEEIEFEGVDELPTTGEFTVYGLILSTRRLDAGWNQRTGGQRFIGHEMATSALAAEGAASARVATDEHHAKLLVCAVLPGRMEKADTLPFSNPDERSRHRFGQ
ncbi:hypothetical protein KDK95_29385 [Actinospica sp. MGRD01-02]|uniref:Uncharacterized protein n=1 Tax=Actinospica acidithermotolerans TaxID=2828514 RepID=A0A941ECY2_9ACTN|nr:hypothetical protein [Actinospica acidithermotolerans]MBR7830450.1 hypothetical protein [Actinospica acidithermotolerans]